MRKVLFGLATLLTLTATNIFAQQALRVRRAMQQEKSEMPTLPSTMVPLL